MGFVFGVEPDSFSIKLLLYKLAIDHVETGVLHSFLPLLGSSSLILSVLSFGLSDGSDISVFGRVVHREIVEVRLSIIKRSLICLLANRFK